MSSNGILAENKVPLLTSSSSEVDRHHHTTDTNLSRRIWVETKKLWHIVGPSIFTRASSYSMMVITQAFAGHVGDVELAAISITTNLILGFNLGLMFCDDSIVSLRYTGVEATRAAGGGVGAVRSGSSSSPSASILLRVLVSCAQLKLGIIATALALSFSWWLIVVGLFLYTVSGRCPLTWTGFSMAAFSDLWAFFKLSISSGIMLCLNIYSLELMIPLSFFAGTGVRVANELGAGNGKAARFASIVSVIESIGIGILFFVLIIFYHNQLALIFTSSQPILDEVHKFSLLLAFTILLNSVQPILSGVAVGAGWQAYVAYINLGCYYLLGVPSGLILGWVFNKGVMKPGIDCDCNILMPTINVTVEMQARNANRHVEKWDAVHHVKP
nr:protein DETOXIFICATION 27-like [Ipomoea batatas]